MTRRIAVVLLTALMLSAGAVAVAGCGGSSKPSPQDTAKTNGEAVGKATKQLVNARSVSDVEAAVPALQDALKTVQANVKDQSGEITAEIKAQEQSITASFNSLKSAVKSANVSAASTAVDSLQASLQDIGSKAQSLASSGDSVTKAFWNGVKEGYDNG